MAGGDQGKEHFVVDRGLRIKEHAIPGWWCGDAQVVLDYWGRLRTWKAQLASLSERLDDDL